MTPRRGSEWTSPSILVAIFGILLAGLGSYLATQRDDTERIARLEAKVEMLIAERGHVRR